MFKRVSKCVFCAIFFIMLVFPLMTTNMINQKVSESEKRRLAPQPALLIEENLNPNFIKDFETWINDNIGFRSSMVMNNARIQYYLFNVLPNNNDMYLGPHGELNYCTAEMIRDYQHVNYYTEEYLLDYTESMQTISDWLESKGAMFFYYQCWDKHSIYPEYFPKTIIQHGEKSKTDLMVEALSKNTTVNVISSKEVLTSAKEEYETYSEWGEPGHWSFRGGYIGYKYFINCINEIGSVDLDIMNEDEYIITYKDQGETLFGCIHEEDILEHFLIKNEKAKVVRDNLILHGDDYRNYYFLNEHSNNDYTILILGDSYIHSYIIDDIAESFNETIFYMGDYMKELPKLIDYYKPDYVVFEAAERVDRTGLIIELAKSL